MKRRNFIMAAGAAIVLQGCGDPTIEQSTSAVFDSGPESVPDSVSITESVTELHQPSVQTVWTSAMIDEGIRQMTTRNEGHIMNVDNNRPGWYSQGAVAMGNTWNDSGAPGWAPKSGQGTDYWWPKFNFWAVLFTEVGNTVSDGFVEIKDQEVQLLYKDANSWTRMGQKNGKMGWGEHYKPDMITSMGVNISTHPGIEPDSFSFQLPRVGAPHWIDGNGEMNIPNVSNIEGVLCSMMIRIDPRGNQNVKCLTHVGGDPKPANRLSWYPGFGVSSAQRVTKEWRRVSAISIEGANTNYAGNRVITQARLRACPPLI